MLKKRGQNLAVDNFSDELIHKKMNTKHCNTSK